MRRLLLSALFLTAVMGVSGQTATGTTQSLPDDPQKLLAAAEPFYDFSSAEMKPWHLKATYQLYDDKGKPSEQGTYEYWWTSPQVYRSTWTRKKATYSDWHTADGKHLLLSKGKPLGYFEEGLRSDFVSPLVPLSPYKNQTTGAPAKTTYKSTVIQAGPLKLSCVVDDYGVSSEQASSFKGGLSTLPAFYCFDPMLHALRAQYSFGVVATEFDNLVKMQGKFLAREVQVAEGKRSILTAAVSTIDALSASDPALVPDPAGVVVHELRPEDPHILPKMKTSMSLIRPEVGMHSGQKAEALLQITIARNGSVRDPRIIVATSAEIGDEAMHAASQLSFTPYMQDGKPVDGKFFLDEVVYVK